MAAKTSRQQHHAVNRDSLAPSDSALATMDKTLYVRLTGEKPAMKRPKPVLVCLCLALLGISASAVSQERPAGSPPLAVWTADDPKCPLPDTSSPHGFADREPYRFKPHENIFEPRIIECGELDNELYRVCTGKNQARDVYELLINGDGIVERVATLRRTPDCWTEEVARYFQTCKFKPATLDGSPICIIYVMTLSVGLQ